MVICEFVVYFLSLSFWHVRIIMGPFSRNSQKYHRFIVDKTREKAWAL